MNNHNPTRFFAAIDRLFLYSVGPPLFTPKCPPEAPRRCVRLQNVESNTNYQKQQTATGGTHRS